MKADNKNNDKRHIIAYVTPYSINLLHLRNPWVAAWWSAAFPGLGHIMLCKYLVAFVLIAWEVLINHMSNLNTAIYYSMIGEFEHAKKIIDVEWFLLYIPAYVFAIFDSYHRTVRFNIDSVLGYHYGYEIWSQNISTLELNKLEKRKPLNVFLWSLFSPSLGYLHINRLPSAFIFTVWFVIIAYFSKILPAIHLTMIGDFKGATQILQIQWLLYFPSLYGFALYDAYVNAVEYNKLFEKNQAKFLKEEYQDKNFVMPK